jgi:hypothetical protein
MPLAGRMTTTETHNPPLIERVERALVLVAYLIEVDGDAYVATYARLEAELEVLRGREDTKDRARRLLASYSRSGGRKAIVDKNLSFNSNGGPLPYLGL